MRGALVAVLLLGGAVGCVTVRGSEPVTVATEAGTVRLEFVEWNEATSDLLKQAVPEAAKVLSRWGGLHEPVRITVVNSHWELEEMVDRPLPGLSAWARRTQVFLWDPCWWPLPPRAARSRAGRGDRPDPGHGAAEARADAQPDVPAGGGAPDEIQDGFRSGSGREWRR